MQTNLVTFFRKETAINAQVIELVVMIATFDYAAMFEPHKFFSRTSEYIIRKKYDGLHSVSTLSLMFDVSFHWHH